jgi:hypothetical protein
MSKTFSPSSASFWIFNCFLKRCYRTVLFYEFPFSDAALCGTIPSFCNLCLVSQSGGIPASMPAGRHQKVLPNSIFLTQLLRFFFSPGMSPWNPMCLVCSCVDQIFCLNWLHKLIYLGFSWDLE